MQRREFLQLLAAAPLSVGALNFRRAVYSKLVFPGKNGKLVYAPDEKGNTIPDFSNCGYMGSGISLPGVPARISIEPIQGDAGKNIQAAIDKVSALPPDKNGFRG